MILFGTEVKKTLLASTISREIEIKRGLDRRPEKLVDLKKIGGDLPLDQIRKLEIIRSGEIFSLFIFNDVRRFLTINDLDKKDVETIEGFILKKNGIEILHDEFRIPLSDVFLFVLFEVYSF